MAHLLAVLIAAVATGAVVAAPAAAGGDRAAPASAAVAKSVRAKAFPSCRALVRYARRNAARAVGAPGFLVRPGPAALAAPVATAPDRGAPQPALPAPEAGVDYSGTNVQEAGVDEPDTVKTNGRHVFAIGRGALQAVDVSGDTPKLVGALKLPEGGGELLLHGDRLLVVGTGIYRGAGPRPLPAPATARPASVAPPYPVRSVITEVSVRDPAAMRIVRTLTVDGYYVAARQNGATARVVFSSAPDPLPVAAPDAPRAELAERNRAAARRARLATWMPAGRFANRLTGRRQVKRLVACTAVRRPASFSGVGMLTVLTIDMERGLPAVDSDALLTDAQTAYGSPQSLFVATERWNGASPERVAAVQTTQIHRFDTSKTGQTAYRASGEVGGHVLNQFSLSEHEGVLRVASTETPPWIDTDARTESESFVTTLRERNGRLAVSGRVGGLGRGERIYAVRFLGERGYVVTFRQVDPLYTLDLSDAERPRVLGELKIRGYSAYLHPVGDGLLLGVGQDATERGRQLGTQVSLFDVSDLRNPKRLHAFRLGGGASSSQVEFDHHAFLYWPATRLAVIPVEIYDAATDRPVPPFAGALGLRADHAGLVEVGRATHASEAGPISRSLVVGDRLLTLSDGGMKASRLDTLAPLAWVAFG